MESIRKVSIKMRKYGRLIILSIVSVFILVFSIRLMKELGFGRSVIPDQTGTPSPIRSDLPDPSGTTDPPRSTEPSGSPEPTDPSGSRAKEILASMSLEEKVGQMFIVRCPQEDVPEKIRQYHMGGLILFAKDFRDKSKAQKTEEIRSYQEVSGIPLLIGVDEEGGDVNRVSLFPQYRAYPFKSPQDLYAEGGFDLIESDTVEKAKLLKSLGINLNIAPVCDVSTDSSDYIYSRTFGKNAEETAKYVEKVVSVMVKEKIGCVLKHFPGYGGNKDTHAGIAYDYRSYETFINSDFIPFKAGIEAGAGAVMVSHNIVSSMDSQYPASLSPEVHRILREELGFNGVIMTDDLYMNAIKDFTGVNEASVLAVLAGNDLICCTDFEQQIPAIMEAVKNGQITEERIDSSVLRILEWKLSLGIIS